MSLPSIPETTAEWGKRFEDLSHTDKFVAIAGRLYEKTGQYIVTTDDVISVYEKARWKKPANPADAIAKAANRIFFAEPEEDDLPESDLKLWQFTRTGFNYYKQLVYGDDVSNTQTIKETEDD